MAEANELAEALAQCQEEKVQSMVKDRIAAGVAAADIVTECNRGMTELGERFGRGECFIPELMVGGMIMKAVMADLGPMLEKQESTQFVGTVVMGSVQHDVHDVGKDIVTMMLRGVGFDVIDLGVDVPPTRFVEAVGQHEPAVMGMSVLLTTCYKSVAATVDAVKQANLRDNLAVMVGGAAASNLLAENAGCDFYGKTAIDAVKFAGQIVPMR